MTSLLRIDNRDRRGLAWLKRRAASWKTTLKRRRKYGVRRGAGFEPEEAEVLQALTNIEKAADTLLKE